MVLPVTTLGFSSINTELSRSSGIQFSINDSEGRKLASAGNTGQSLASGSEVRLSNFRGHARTRYTVSTNRQNIVMSDDVSGGNYVAGLSYVSYGINSGVQITSSATSSPSLRSGTWTSGDVIELENAGTIVGKGGSGGTGGFGQGSPGNPGTIGGDAIWLSYSTLITNDGSIWGGGGGGGGGGGATYYSGTFCDSKNLGGGTGGGGAGFGTGANAGTLSTGGAGAVGQYGSSSFCSSSDQGGTGGTGGGPGLSGATGGKSGASGGAPGKSINGIAYLVGSVGGDVRGPQV